MVFNENGSPMENPEFVQYGQQDAAISAWLLSTISPTLHNRLIGDSSSVAQVWSTLNRIFGHQSTTKVMRIKHLYDCLADCGQQVLLKEQKSIILNGLLLEYGHIVFIIIMSPMPFDLQGITTTLLDAEAHRMLT
ncbi:hypothetical protein J1N35_001367 [Gossypium stocksii]|uniref:Uncharacterized protein n=1 Tax=Gossypium stocksii TaxID=47602 RepID=A0A9D3WJZ4_9ROSI|nr:hypothetical protein J1N35_001367 [Gossypium stocksii]